jgi:hypothetical protein
VRHEESISRLLLYHLASKVRISGAHECNWGWKEAIYGRNDVLLLVGCLHPGECDSVLAAAWSKLVAHYDIDGSSTVKRRQCRDAI